MNKGVQAYKNNKYPDAVKHFKQAVELDSKNENAELYLATSYMTQWIPGADSPDNKKNYDMARQVFQQVLSRDPKNDTALSAMGFMSYSNASAGTPEQRHASLEEAKKWNERRLEVNPKDAEAYYYLGVINWSEAFTPIQTVRVEQHMNALDPGPIKDLKIKDGLRGKYEADIEKGIDYLHKALAIDPENEDAMSYLNLLLRKKADLEDNTDQAKADIAQAEDWSNKSINMKKIKATRPKKKGEEGSAS